jgi:hypothetical protein
VALARVFDVSVIDLMTPPDAIEVTGRKRGELIRAPLRIQVGGDEVAPDVFFRLAFLLPGSYRSRWADSIFRGSEAGRIAEDSELGRRRQILSRAFDAVVSEEEIRKRSN